jgi:hypothetical protein
MSMAGDQKLDEEEGKGAYSQLILIQDMNKTETLPG